MTISSRSLALSAASAVVLAGLSSAGCSGASTSTPTSNDYDDVAQSTAALVVTANGGGEIGSISDSASLALGVTPSDVSLNASGSFGADHAGVTYTFDVTCTDASGAALAHCGPTTNAATASVDWSGNLTLPNLQADVTRHGNWTITGVQTGTSTFNGTGDFTFASTFTSAFRNATASTNLTYNATYSSIVYVAASHQVTSGSIHYTVDASRAASSTNGQSNTNLAIDAVVTFGAGGGATITLDGSHSYQVSATGVVIKI
jgi:hypothetical protein